MHLATLDALACPAFELGWDYAHHGVVPPADHLRPGSPLGHGWEAGRATFGTRTLRADRHVRKWLQLRLHALARGRAFDGVTVNPAFLHRIDVPRCPVTRETLTHGTGTPSDASVDRVNNDAGYAAGNLAVMSTRANAAKADYGCDDAMAFVRQIELGRLGRIDGLDAAQWARLAVLASFVTPLPHARAATLPLLVLPPARLRVLNPVQALQVLLTLQFLQPGHARRGAAIAALMPDADARRACDRFLLAFLARHLAAARARSSADGDAPACERERLADLWRDPLLQRRWRDLALRVGAEDCERVVERAAKRGLAGPALRWLAAPAATEGWALETRGYAGTPPLRKPVPLAPFPAPTPMPGRRPPAVPAHAPRPAPRPVAQRAFLASGAACA